jgi:hypothetical protein
MDIPAIYELSKLIISLLPLGTDVSKSQTQETNTNHLGRFFHSAMAIG